MPPRGPMYRLNTIKSILRTVFVVDENKAFAKDTPPLVHTAATKVVLPREVRRIRVAINDDTIGTKVWFCWGANDRTGNSGGRILVNSGAPFEMILERPEGTFWFRRVGNAGVVTVSLFGTL